MTIDIDKFFDTITTGRDGRDVDVLVSPVVFWDVAEQLNAKVELLAYMRNATAAEREAGAQGPATCTEFISVMNPETGESYRVISEPDVPADYYHYAKVSP